MKRTVKSLFVVLSVAAIVSGASATALAQIPNLPRIPNPPPPPAQLQPVINVIGPPIIQVCLAQADVDTLMAAAAALAPIPVSPHTVTGPVRNLLLFDVACGYFWPNTIPPLCSLDDTIYGSAPVTLVSLPPAASLIAQEALGVERLLSSEGAPVQGKIAPPVYDQLGCKVPR